MTARMAGIIGGAATAALGMWLNAKRVRAIAEREAEQEDREAEVIRTFAPELQRIAGEEGLGAARGT